VEIHLGHNGMPCPSHHRPDGPRYADVNSDDVSNSNGQASSTLIGQDFEQDAAKPEASKPKAAQPDAGDGASLNGDEDE
jgi:hypothetical protein